MVDCTILQKLMYIWFIVSSNKLNPRILRALAALLAYCLNDTEKLFCLEQRDPEHELFVEWFCIMAADSQSICI